MGRPLVCPFWLSPPSIAIFKNGKTKSGLAFVLGIVFRHEYNVAYIGVMGVKQTAGFNRRFVL
jgi:hypothetical protein